MLRALLALLVVANLLFFAFTPRLRSTASSACVRSAIASPSASPTRCGRRRSACCRSAAPRARAPIDAGVPCYETPTFTAGDAAAVEAALAANLPAGSWIDNPRRAQPRRPHRGDAHLPRDRRRCHADGAAGDAEARRRRARLQLQSVRPGRAAAALSAARSRADDEREREHRREQEQQPADAERAAAARRRGRRRAAPAASRRPARSTATDSVVVETKPLLSVVVSWMTNEPAAVGETTTESALAALVIVAPVVPALRIVQS